MFTGASLFCPRPRLIPNLRQPHPLEPQVRHHENNGELKQSLDPRQPGVLHAQLHNPIDIGRRRDKLFEDANLIRQQKTKTLNDKNDGDNERRNDSGAVKVPLPELLG